MTGPARNSLRRVMALIRKESLQILRDPSAFLIAGVLPLLLLVIFGTGEAKGGEAKGTSPERPATRCLWFKNIWI
jgi:hypothetical protein